jgi:DNA-binding GntR family transcriptional regulator
MPAISKENKKRTGDHEGRAYKKIRQMLFYNEIIPGQKISCSDLSKKLKMSPTPVIQALKFLQFQNLVRHEPNRGYFIQNASVKEIEEVYDLRIILEKNSLDMGLKNLDENNTSRLKEVFEKSSEVFNQFISGNVTETVVNDVLLLDREFHLTIASLSGSTLHEKFLQTLFDLTYLKYRNIFAFTTPFRHEVKDEHGDILFAIVTKNLDLAKKAVSRHLKNARKQAILCLKRKIDKKGNRDF